MHVHVPCRHQRKAGFSPQPPQGGESASVVWSPEELHGEPDAFSEDIPDPPGVLQLQRLIRAKQGQTSRHAIGQIRTPEAILPLRGCPAPLGDDLREVPIAFPVYRQQYQARSILQADLAAYEKLEAVVLGGDMGAHHPCQRALVGECQSRIAQPCRPGHQLLGVGGPAQEGEIAEAVQLRVCRRWQ